MIKFLNKIKFLIIIIFIKFTLITNTLSDQLKNIEVEGNERLQMKQ